MVTEIQYTSIKRVLDNLLDHPMLSDLSLEQAVRHTLRFISLHGYSKLYQDKIATVEINDFRGLLPCDLISIIQVKDLKTGLCLRSMSDNYPRGMQEPTSKHPDKKCHTSVPKKHLQLYPIPYLADASFKTQGRVLYTSFPVGEVEVAYKAIPVDDDGFPLLIDNETYLAALEAYIKKQVFTVKFDTGKISGNILENAKHDYAVLSRELLSEFTTPSVSEMESISRALNTMIPSFHEFDKGFKHWGRREYLKNH